jgi:hypothetical protein
VTQLTIFDAGSASVEEPPAPTPIAVQEADPARMTRAAFIAKHQRSFVRYQGHRNLIGVQTLDGGRILPLPPGSQKNGRLLRSVEDVLGDIHSAAVREQIAAAKWSRTEVVPPDHVLADYPDLARCHSLGITPEALAKLEAQPTSYRTIGADASAPRTLSELKRRLVAGAALTRFSEMDSWPLRLVVRRTQTNAFVAGPIDLESRTVKYADGFWHRYERAPNYSIGRNGFDVMLSNGRAVSYRYGHLPLDTPCPALVGFGPVADA